MLPNAQIDMFTITAYDPPLRDNRDAMEYPFLSIQKGRKAAISYANKDGSVQLEITDGGYGIATIWDWDLMIYLTAHINDAIENNQPVSEWVEFAPHDALRYMGKGNSGRHYQELVKSLRRLATTNIITSLREDDVSGTERIIRWFTDYEIPKKYSINKFVREEGLAEADPSKPWRVKLPDWLLKSILRRTGILAVHPQYFKLTGGLERWLYRLARKAVPDNADFPVIKFKMETLHERSGSTRPLRKFAHDIRNLAEKNKLPEYNITVKKQNRTEYVFLMRDKNKPRRMPRDVQALIEK